MTNLLFCGMIIYIWNYYHLSVTYHLLINFVPTQLLTIFFISSWLVISTGTLCKFKQQFSHVWEIFIDKMVTGFAFQVCESCPLHYISVWFFFDKEKVFMILELTKWNLKKRKRKDIEKTNIHGLTVPYLYLILSLRISTRSSKACLKALMITVGCICCWRKGSATASISPPRKWCQDISIL